MRRSIEMLARLVIDDRINSPQTTIGELARKYGESTDRVLDAIDVIKIIQGQPTQTPEVDWDGTPLSRR